MTQTDQAAYDAVYQYIGEQMRQGIADGTIHAALLGEGWDSNIARQLVANMRTQQPAPTTYVPRYQAPARPVQRYDSASTGGGGRGGMGNMALGGGICILGIIVTAGSFMAASSGRGGGGYVIAWGAIVFGAIRFFKGLAQMSGGE